jgi:hypothetical protein
MISAQYYLASSGYSVDYYEKLAAGIAALSVGTYGYYNEDKGAIVKLIYSGTQTAGLVMISSAVLEYNRPSLILSNDLHFKNFDSMSYEKYKAQVVSTNRRARLAEIKSTSYTTAILGAMYLYNGSQEDNKSIRNLFYFLGGNFVLISGASFYKLYSYTQPVSQKPQVVNSVSINLLPYPEITMIF